MVFLAGQKSHTFSAQIVPLFGKGLCAIINVKRLMKIKKSKSMLNVIFNIDFDFFVISSSNKLCNVL